MNATDIVGWTYNASAYCPECARKLNIPKGFEDQEEIPSPIFACSEWDSAPSCDCCHEIIEGVTIIDPPPIY